jgi:heme/copper-type cytochrome/quinol oxidase subunit 2
MIANAQVRGSRDGVVSQTSNATQKIVKSSSAQSSAGESLIIVFFIVAIIWMGVSAALVYHWRKYGKGDSKVALAQGIYFTTSLIILVVALFSLS